MSNFTTVITDVASGKTSRVPAKSILQSGLEWVTGKDLDPKITVSHIESCETVENGDEIIGTMVDRVTRTNLRTGNVSVSHVKRIARDWIVPAQFRG